MSRTDCVKIIYCNILPYAQSNHLLGWWVYVSYHYYVTCLQPSWDQSHHPQWDWNWSLLIVLLDTVRVSKRCQEKWSWWLVLFNDMVLYGSTVKQDQCSIVAPHCCITSLLFYPSTVHGHCIVLALAASNNSLLHCAILKVSKYSVLHIQYKAWLTRVARYSRRTCFKIYVTLIEEQIPTRL